jgi:hypothetical protein
MLGAGASYKCHPEWPRTTPQSRFSSVVALAKKNDHFENSAYHHQAWLKLGERDDLI